MLFLSLLWSHLRHKPVLCTGLIGATFPFALFRATRTNVALLQLSLVDSGLQAGPAPVPGKPRLREHPARHHNRHFPAKYFLDKANSAHAHLGFLGRELQTTERLLRLPRGGFALFDIRQSLSRDVLRDRDCWLHRLHSLRGDISNS